MTGIRKIIFIMALITFAFPRSSSGEKTNFEINANSNDIEAKLGWEFAHHVNNPAIGAGLIYSDEYTISNLSISVKDKAFIPALTLGLGFKGLLGEVENHNKDFDLTAISFLLLGEYDLKKKYPNLPINVAMSIAVAPSPLSFSDSRRYLEYSSTIYLYIVRNAAIGVGYRAFDAYFDDTSGRIKRSEDAVFFGFRLDY